MNILTTWLRSYLPALPVDDRQLADDLTLRGIAVEGVHPLASGSLFEMDITTNRVDAMNHYGIAREAATIYNLPLSPLIKDSSFRPEAAHLAAAAEKPASPPLSPLIKDSSFRPEAAHLAAAAEKPASPPLSPLIKDSSSRPEAAHLAAAAEKPASPPHSPLIKDSSSRPEAAHLAAAAEKPASPPLSPLIKDSSFRPEAAHLAAAAEKPASPPQKSTQPAFPIRIEAPQLCGRFTAQVLRDVTIAPSTGKISEYFTLLNQKQISNAVDASNYTLLSMGHPTHAFDLDKLEGGIVVRLAKRGEKLKLLDGTERTLEPDDLVVADEKKALALAGVMGGWDSMITPETKNILVEAAWFDPATVRRSSRRHLLHTDASHRFERGADFNAAPIANQLVSQLILESGGHAEGDLIDIIIPEAAARTTARPPITLSIKQVQRHLGATLDPEGITKETVAQYLTALGCTLKSVTEPDPPRPAFGNAGSAANISVPSAVASRYPEASASGLSSRQEKGGFSPWDMHSSTPDTTFQVQLPSWRLDLEREIDLIEEVARVYGYNRFADTLPTPGIVIAHPTAAKEHAVRARLLALGYSESISSTFTSHQDAANLGTPYMAASSPGVGIRASEPPSSAAPANPPGTIPLENPLSEEVGLLRPSLIPGMVTMLSHNLNRDVREVRLFEQGQIFTGTTGEVTETAQLSLGLTTANPQAIPPHMAQDAPFFELKGAIESLLSLFDIASSPQSNDVSSRPALNETTELSSRPEAAHFAAEAERTASPPIDSARPTPPLAFTAEAPQWLQPGRSATALLNNQPIAHFGELAQAEAAQRKLRQPIYVAQLNLAKLYALPLKKVTAHDLSRFQAVERDFSFVFPDAVQWHTVAHALESLNIEELQSIKPAEVWRDPKKYPGVYSLLVRTVFQSHDRTLRDEELSTWSTSIIKTLTSLGGTLRS